MSVNPATIHPTDLEALWAIPIGPDVDTPPLEIATATTARAAAEAVVERALRRAPCLVSFSGGRDSSAILALAAAVARRCGLPAPIPVTNRFPAVAETAEDAWQERVVAHLGLGDWIQLSWTDELDIVGPWAVALLKRHGVLFPFNGHFHAPLLEAARGGSLLTGIGGDELFEPIERLVLARLVYGRMPPSRHLVTALAAAALPRRARRWLHAREEIYHGLSWLRPAARAALIAADTDWWSREPLRFDRILCRWWWRSRMLQCNLAAKHALAADYGVSIVHPFAEPEVVAAYAGQRGRIGPPSREWALRDVVGDLLPHDVIARASKSTFNGVFWTERARSFVEQWDGRGVPTDLVDPDALLQEWRKPRPDAHSFTLLHQAYVHSHLD